MTLSMLWIAFGLMFTTTTEAVAQDIEVLRLGSTPGTSQPMSLSVNAGKGRGWQTGLVLSITTDIFEADNIEMLSNVHSELMHHSMPIIASLESGDLARVASALNRHKRSHKRDTDATVLAPLEQPSPTPVLVDRPEPIEALTFEARSSRMTAKTQRLLAHMARTLQTRSEIALVVVEGHGANPKLSQKRTAAIIDRLTELGVERHRLTSRPIRQNDDQAVLHILMIDETHTLR